MLRPLMLALLGTSFYVSDDGAGRRDGVLFFARKVCERAQGALLGFAAGVMMAASVWSLILPAIEQTEAEGRLPPFLPAAAGIVLGALTLFLLDELVRRRGGGEVHSDFFAPLGHHAAQHPRGHGRRPRVRARGGRGELCRRVRAGAWHRRAELSRGRGGGAAGVPIGQVETARLLDRRALRRGGAAVRRARRARGGGNPRADAVASELCSGGDALRRGGGAAAARADGGGRAASSWASF